MSEASRARMAAVPLEAKIDKLQRLQGGDWKLTLTVADMPVEILTVPLGTRYQCAFVEIGDDEQPVRRKKTEGERAKAHFEAMCQDREFYAWVWEQYSGVIPDAVRDASVDGIARSRSFLKHLMNIESANELIDNPGPWYRLYEEYKHRDNLR